MTNIIPFSNDSKLPAHLASVSVDRGDELDAGGIGFPVIGYKGKVWSIKRSGEVTRLMRPDDPDTPVSALQVVILRAQKGLSKTFFQGAYKEGSDDKPTCYSDDGVAPAGDAQAPQSKSCAACPHNVFGTGRGEDGPTRGKACSDVKRLAVAAPGTLSDPMLLRVPPASLKNLTEYGRMLRTRGVKDYAAMVTRVSFDHEVSTPRLQFKAVGFLSEDTYAEAQGMYDDDLVQTIIGLTGAPMHQAPPESAPAPETEGEGEGEEAAPPPPPPKKAAKKAEPKTVIETDDLATELESMLAGLDD